MDGWPGVFRPLRHYVAPDAPRVLLDGRYARGMGLAGLNVLVAVCGSPCWPPDNTTHDLPWCPACRRAARNSGVDPMTPVGTSNPDPMRPPVLPTGAWR